jgi:Cu(I)/Ag(I) efflux system membrane fusion protein
MKARIPSRIAASPLVVLAVALFIVACDRKESAPTAASSGHDHAAAAPHTETAQAEATETYYTCPMHPSVHSPTPGQCPICGMNLVAVARGSESAAVDIGTERAQLIGVKTIAVERTAFAPEIRTLGRVTYDETQLTDVTVKFAGFIGTLHADSAGKHVERGEPLFEIYSPELYAAQQEFLSAIASSRMARDTAAPHRADYLIDAARQRLRLWDLTAAQIDAIARAGVPMREIEILSPVTGNIVEKDVVAGSSVEPGQRLLRIADLSTVWVEADVYESDVGLIQVGDHARVVLPHLRDRTIDGTVAFVYPWIESATRTARVRLRVENASFDLKPDMYADVLFAGDLGPQLAVPENAVLYAGDKRYVFVEIGTGRFEPRSVKLGRRAGDLIAVSEGLMEGERIVVSGNFLIAAESRLKVALEDWK